MSATAIRPGDAFEFGGQRAFMKECSISHRRGELAEMTVTLLVERGDMSLTDLGGLFTSALASPEVRKAVNNYIVQTGGKRAIKLE